MAQKTRTQIQSDTDSTIYQNSSNSISASDHNSHLKDIADSFQNRDDDKATGADVTAGTNDSKHVTPKALKDAGFGNIQNMVYSDGTGTQPNNTTTETSLFDPNDINGSKTISANTLKIGDRIEVFVCGSVTTTAGPVNITYRLKAGSVNLSTFTYGEGSSSVNFIIRGHISVWSIGATGNLRGSLEMVLDAGSGRTSLFSSSTVDTTSDFDIDLTSQFAVANALNGYNIENAWIQKVVR